MSEQQRLRSVVRSRITSILPNAANPSPAARAALAHLRRGVGKDVGSVPQIWQYTHVDGPDGVWTDCQETAVHLALTQWALHQQSESTPMHSADRTFGEALRVLATRQDAESPETTPAYRRMMALAGSRTLPGITTHARGLIGLLKSEGISFDYGRWAEDLLTIQMPGRGADVQRRWGRDFYRLRTHTEATADTTGVADDAAN